MAQANFISIALSLLILSACAADTSQDSQTLNANPAGYTIDPATGEAIIPAITPAASSDTSAVAGFWDDSSWDGSFFERYLYLTADGQWQDFERRDLNSGENCLESRQGTLSKIAEKTYRLYRGSGYSETVDLEVTSAGLSWNPANGQDNRVIPRAFFGVSDVQVCTSGI